LRRIAIHEAGHALAAVRLGLSDEITASIIRRGAFDGFVRLRRAAAFCTPTELDDIIVCVLAGRAAEQHAFGDASTLSGGDASDSDLATATRYAADAVARHGFSDQGLFWHAPDGHLAGVRTPDYLRAAAMAKLNIAYTRALSLAAENDRALNKIADRLIERRVLTHAELASIFAGGPERPEPQQKPPRRFTAKPLSKLAVTPSNWDFPWNSQQTDNAARK
jgi:ATP-dependent Zn protease